MQNEQERTGVFPKIRRSVDENPPESLYWLASKGRKIGQHQMETLP